MNNKDPRVETNGRKTTAIDKIIDGLVSIPASMFEEAKNFMVEVPKFFFDFGKTIANIFLPDNKPVK